MSLDYGWGTINNSRWGSLPTSIEIDEADHVDGDYDDDDAGDDDGRVLSAAINQLGLGSPTIFIFYQALIRYHLTVIQSLAFKKHCGCVLTDHRRAVLSAHMSYELAHMLNGTPEKSMGLAVLQTRPTLRKSEPSPP